MAACYEIAGAADQVDEHALNANGGFMQVHLPVHQAAGAEEVFDAVDALFIDHEFVVVDIEHGNDAVNADTALLDAGEEGVAVKVIEAIHIELTGHQSVKKLSRIAVSEDLQGQVECAVKAFVQLQHKAIGDAFMVHAVEQRFFQGMRKWAMPHVVKEDGQLSGLVFLI